MDFSWLWIVPVLGILVVVHELGHFLTALYFGIRVEEFGIGFPPRIAAIRRNGIDYSINWLPIGGFVKIVGENGDSDDPRSFGRAAAWKRIIVLAAGSFMNLLLALIIFASMSVSGTKEIAASTTGVGDVLAGQPAYAAGMQPGDHIVKVAGQVVTSSDDIRALSRENAGKPTEFVVERSGKQVTLTVTPNVNPIDGAFLGIGLEPWITPARVDSVGKANGIDKSGLQSGDIITRVNDKPVDNVSLASYLLTNSSGPATVTVQRNGQEVGPVTLNGTGAKKKSYDLTFAVPTKTVYYGPFDALGRALKSTWEVVASVPRGIAQAFKDPAHGAGVTGPVGIGQLTGEVAQQSGFDGLLRLTALLGISLFMINMLPLPALDGGRLLFILIELVRGGRRVAPEKEGLVHFAGMVLLLGFLAVITFFDVQRLLEGNPIIPR